MTKNRLTTIGLDPEIASLGDIDFCFDQSKFEITE
jgi:hypothetical protein